MGFELRKEPALPVMANKDVPKGKFHFVLSCDAHKDCDDLIATLEQYGELVRVEAAAVTIERVQEEPVEEE